MPKHTFHASWHVYWRRRSILEFPVAAPGAMRRTHPFVVRTVHSQKLYVQAVCTCLTFTHLFTGCKSGAGSTSYAGICQRLVSFITSVTRGKPVPIYHHPPRQYYSQLHIQMAFTRSRFTLATVPGARTLLNSLFSRISSQQHGQSRKVPSHLMSLKTFMKTL